MTEVREKYFTVTLISSTSSHLYENDSSNFTNLLPSELIFNQVYTVGLQAVYYPRGECVVSRQRRSMNTDPIIPGIVDVTDELSLPPAMDRADTVRSSELRMGESLRLPPVITVHGGSSLPSSRLPGGMVRVHATTRQRKGARKNPREPVMTSPENREGTRPVLEMPAEMDEASHTESEEDVAGKAETVEEEEVLPTLDDSTMVSSASSEDVVVKQAEKAEYGTDTIMVNDEACSAELLPPRFMCVYCSIIKPVIVGDQYLDLLAIIPLSGTGTFEIREVMRRVMITDRISDISIRITDEYGRRINGIGETVIILSFLSSQ